MIKYYLMEYFNVTIVGAGLAGSECALVLSSFENINIKLIEMRPKVKTLVHKTSDCAELVCSNSFKSIKWASAPGMLKYELAKLGSPLLLAALNHNVAAGNALAIDRRDFSQEITKLIQSKKNIEFCVEEFFDIKNELKNCDCLILATGPLTSDALSAQLADLTGTNQLSFYDAAAPIVMADSINYDLIFSANRYQDDLTGDYLNSALDKNQYEVFIENLINAGCVIKKSFESKDLFQACQPIEEIAKSGFDAPRHGPLKPTGINDPKTGRWPFAVVQLRSENTQKTAYNLVGFQTNLTFSEQKRVFSLIPGLENAEFARFGVMHRNTFVNAPCLLNQNLQLEKCSNLFLAGQLTGTEGYMEAVRSGHHVAISVLSKLFKTPFPKLSENCAFGALLSYSTDKNTKNYQPMHVNFGILPPLEKIIKSKKDRYFAYAQRGKNDTDKYVDLLSEAGLINKSQIFNSKEILQKMDKLWVKN